MKYRTKILKVFFLLSVALAISACATILDGENKKIIVNTKSIDTKIYLNGNFLSNKSTETFLRKRDRNTIYVTQLGCNDFSYEVQRRLSTKTLITIWCLPCVAIDAASGAMWDISESLIEINPTCAQ